MTTLEEYPGRCLGSKPEHPRAVRFLADTMGVADQAASVPTAGREGMVRDAQAERQSLAASRPAVRVCRRQPKNHSAKSPAFPSPLDNAPARAHSTASNPEGSGVVHLRHPFTKEWDGEAGMVQMHHRWYSNELGVFVGRSMLDRVSEEPYVFAENNPASGFDFNGRIRVGIEDVKGIIRVLDLARGKIVDKARKGANIYIPKQRGGSGTAKKIAEDAYGKNNILYHRAGEQGGRTDHWQPRNRPPAGHIHVVDQIPGRGGNRIARGGAAAAGLMICVFTGDALGAGASAGELGGEIVAGVINEALSGGAFDVDSPAPSSAAEAINDPRVIEAIGGDPYDRGFW